MCQRRLSVIKTNSEHPPHSLELKLHHGWGPHVCAHQLTRTLCPLLAWGLLKLFHYQTCCWSQINTCDLCVCVWKRSSKSSDIYAADVLDVLVVSAHVAQLQTKTGLPSAQSNDAA